MNVNEVAGGLPIWSWLTIGFVAFSGIDTHNKRIWQAASRGFTELEKVQMKRLLLQKASDSIMLGSEKLPQGYGARTTAMLDTIDALPSSEDRSEPIEVVMPIAERLLCNQQPPDWMVIFRYLKYGFLIPIAIAEPWWAALIYGLVFLVARFASTILERIGAVLLSPFLRRGGAFRIES